MKVNSRKFLFKPSRIVIIGSMNFYNNSCSSSSSTSLVAPRVNDLDVDDQDQRNCRTSSVFRTAKKEFSIIFYFDDQMQYTKIGIETKKFDDNESCWKKDLTGFALPVPMWLEFVDKLIEALGKVASALKTAKPAEPCVENNMGEEFTTIANKTFYWGEKNRFLWKILSIDGNLYVGLQSFKFDEVLKRFRIDMKGFFLSPPEWQKFSDGLLVRLERQKKNFAEAEHFVPNSSSLRFDESKLPTYSSNVPERNSPIAPIGIIMTNPVTLKRKHQGMLGIHPRS